MDVEKIMLAALAGLLHDVGKFALRADIGSTRSWDAEARREYRYKHALLSADFVSRYVPSAWRPAVLSAVAYHHQPTSAGDKLVMLADWLAAAERSQGDDDSNRVVHPQQLQSIFCSVTTTSVAGDRLSAPERSYLPLQPLRLDRDVLFPKPQPAPPDEVWRHYSTLWDQFAAEADSLRQAHEPHGNLGVYLEQLHMLLQRFAWCVPSAYFGSLPDISLYDHSRMTAALAAAMAKQDPDEGWLDWISRTAADSAEPVARLVLGDISGVQEFIYTITERGATSALRGRSFYLQLLTEAVARYVLRRLNLPITSLVYSGGGKFYLLASTADAEELAAVQRDISRTLLHHHRGDLYLALTSATLTAQTFFNGRLATVWSELQERARATKLRRFAELGPDIAQLFAVPEQGGNSDNVCSVCGQEHPDVTTDVKSGDDRSDSPRKCRPCRSYEALGDALRRADYLRLRTRVPDETFSGEPGDFRQVLAALGMQADPLQEVGEPTDYREVIYTLGDDVALPASGQLRAVGRRFFVNVTPTLSLQDYQRLSKQDDFAEQLPAVGSVKPFSAMAFDSTGIRRLGVLRMDVDNLGVLFSAGLGDAATLSRMAALSFAISLYFEGWVEQLARELSPDDRLYSIYSGGDDLFFVGSWDRVVELARCIRADLTGYVARHPGITASGGIALVTSKYPLYQAARDAGDAERAAKSLQWWSDDLSQRKDAVSFLGRTVPWQRFGLGDVEAGFDSVTAMKQFLVNRERRPLIRRLARYDANYEELAQSHARAGIDRNRQGQPQPLWGPYMYRAFYELSQLARQSGDSESATSVRDHLVRTNYTSLSLVGLAARWAELASRQQSQNEKESSE